MDSQATGGACLCIKPPYTGSAAPKNQTVWLSYSSGGQDYSAENMEKLDYNIPKVNELFVLEKWALHRNVSFNVQKLWKKLRILNELKRLSSVDSAIDFYLYVTNVFCRKHAPTHSILRLLFFPHEYKRSHHFANFGVPNSGKWI